MEEQPSQAELDRKLGDAVLDGAVDSVKELLSQGASANAIGIMNAPMLMTAINSKNVALVRMLIDAGADVNYTMKIDMGLGAPVTDTPLKRAKDAVAQDIIQLLTAAGAKE